VAAAARPVPAVPGAGTAPSPAPVGAPGVPAARTGQRWWRPVPTGRLAAAVLAAAVAAPLLPLALPWGVVVTVGAVLALAAADLARACDPRTVEVERRLPAVVRLAATAEVTWAVRVPGRRPVPVAVADELAPSLGAAARRFHLTALPGRTHQVTTTLRPRRRGRFLPAELAVRTTGRLGLAARQATRRQPGELRVYPPFGPRQHAEVTARIRLAGVGDRRDRVPGGGTDFDQLREYQVDDDARRIDWSATARVAKPIVRTYRVERHQTLQLLFDNGRIMAGRVAGAPRAEHAIDGALMLTAAASRLGDRVGLTAFDRVIRSSVPPRTGTGQLTRVCEALYQLEPELVESDYQAAFAHLAATARRRSLVCLLTELGDRSLEETLLPALPVLARTHLVLVGAARDPDVVAWAAGPPATTEDAYRQAAALQHLEGRRRLALRLRALGAVVVDRPPGELAPALTDAYLRAKSTGRL
jgi:uncharacterized protein (DUF58 family)